MERKFNFNYFDDFMPTEVIECEEDPESVRAFDLLVPSFLN